MHFADSVFVVLFTTVTLMSRNDSGTPRRSLTCSAGCRLRVTGGTRLTRCWRFPADLFFFTDALQKQLVTGTAGTSAPSFNSITTVADAYAWMEGPLVATLYSAVTFDGDDTYRSLHSNAIDRDGAPNFPGCVADGLLRTCSARDACQRAADRAAPADRAALSSGTAWS